MSENAKSWLAGIFTVGLLAMIISVGAVALAADNSGRQPNNHPETYSHSQLMQVSDTAFIASGDGPTPQQLCRGGSGVDDHWPITSFDGTPAEWISCDKPQTFGATGEASPNLGHSIISTVQQMWVWVAGGALLALLAAIACFAAVSEQLRRREEDRHEQERQQRIKEALGQKTALLGAAYADGLIDDDQLDRALGKMVNAAYTPDENTTHEQAVLLRALGIEPAAPEGR